MSAVPKAIAEGWLESGDRMARDEFHRRYEAAPEDLRAELVEGVVYVASPVRWAYHDRQAVLARDWLSAYAADHADVAVGHDATLFVDSENEYQPDAFLFRRAGGQVQVRPDGYLEGAPELVIEVSATTASRDLNDKKRVYERNGVREYLVWRVLDGALDWFRSDGDAFEAVSPNADGVIESAEFPGLRLAVASLLAEDRAALLAALR